MVIQLIRGPATRTEFGSVEERKEAVDTGVSDCQLGTTATKLASRVVLLGWLADGDADF